LNEQSRESLMTGHGNAERTAAEADGPHRVQAPTLMTGRFMRGNTMPHSVRALARFSRPVRNYRRQHASLP
jgi:hypothetical protein